MAGSEFSDFSKLVMRYRPFHRLRDPWQAIRQFTPNWFAMTMGTGIVYLLLVASPVQLPGQAVVARILWIFDSALYLFFAIMLACRMMLFAETIKPMLDHPVQSLFLGTIPMGLIPIINGTVIFGGPLFGGFATHLAAYLWWADALLALTIACFIPYRMFTTQKHSVEQITALWLLPVVAPEVTASSAGLIAAHLEPIPVGPMPAR
jgi:tellurite resistance protein TehA-like permease